MDINELAKYMRERALLIESDEQLDERSLRDLADFKIAKEQKLRKLEELKKLHFNAGRWVGGARDYTARQAFARLQEIEK
jgi:hypothetical protein